MAFPVATVKILNDGGEMRDWSLFLEICNRAGNICADGHVRTVGFFALST